MRLAEKLDWKGLKVVEVSYIEVTTRLLLLHPT